ncbi:hypothetical protein GQ54DRAFT_314063 [Martensiomyces pterosporus]|nr:hypothetical protein GQ54DRAFT_314063 [Martensiomyces pterosporus]
MTQTRSISISSDPLTVGWIQSKCTSIVASLIVSLSLRYNPLAGQLTTYMRWQGMYISIDDKHIVARSTHQGEIILKVAGVLCDIPMVLELQEGVSSVVSQ